MSRRARQKGRNPRRKCLWGLLCGGEIFLEGLRRPANSRAEIASAPVRRPEVDDEGLRRPPFVVAPLGGEGRVLVDHVVDGILALEDGEDAAKVAAALL